MQLRLIALASLSFLAACGSDNVRPALSTNAVSAAQSFAFAGKVKEEKKARKNDIADKYILETDGDFFRTVNGRTCQITSGVEDFKVSMHPNDAAMVYFLKGGDLFVLTNAKDLNSKSNCPKASISKDPILRDVKKYTVVSNTNTNVVNMALSEKGRFVAWEDKNIVLQAGTGVAAGHRAVVDFSNNLNFGAEGKPFGSYVAFAIDSAGCILKVKGIDTADSNWDKKCGFKSIQDFKKQHDL